MALKNDINAQVKLDIINYNGASDGQAYILLGESSMGDQPYRLYYYFASSTATADGENILPATGMGVGRFHKLAVEETRADWNATTGAAQILNKPTIAIVKRQETYSGTTNSSGNYTVSFSTSFSVAPNIQANITGGTNTNLIKITSISATGFTVNVVNRTDTLGLLPAYSNVNGATVDILITEK